MSDNILQIKDKDDKVIGWLSKESWDNYTNFYKKQLDKFERSLIYGDVKLHSERYEAKAKDHAVYAYILVGNTQMLCYYNSETNTAFKCDNYARTNMTWKKFKFVRFCTSFDL